MISVVLLFVQIRGTPVWEVEKELMASIRLVIKLNSKSNYNILVSTVTPVFPAAFMSSIGTLSTPGDLFLGMALSAHSTSATTIPDSR